jgi:hypothetical protein
VPPVERLNRSRGCTIGTVCVGGGCAGGAPESRSVRRLVGGCRGRWGREMGIGGELLPLTSGLGVLLKNSQV